jgi:hypothetical protein
VPREFRNLIRVLFYCEFSAALLKREHFVQILLVLSSGKEASNEFKPEPGRRTGGRQ